ncbi:MAG TPA: hypothetical protein VMG10_23335 [Gemmataceae bacterium]|nr:hypothetical protein [Gemmataceae bacterium]
MTLSHGRGQTRTVDTVNARPLLAAQPLSLQVIAAPDTGRFAAQSVRFVHYLGDTCEKVPFLFGVRRFSAAFFSFGFQEKASKSKRRKSAALQKKTKRTDAIAAPGEGGNEAGPGEEPEPALQPWGEEFRLFFSRLWRWEAIIRSPTKPINSDTPL